METVFNMDTVWRLITPVLNEYTHMHIYEREREESSRQTLERSYCVCSVHT